MISNLSTSLFWLSLGCISWYIGKLTRLDSRSSHISTEINDYFVVIPKWARIACAVPRNKLVLDLYSIYFQIGGLTLMLAGIVIGFLENPITVINSIWINLVLYLIVPTLLIRYWRRKTPK